LIKLNRIKDKLKELFNYKSFNFYLVLFFVLRLYHITDPPLEAAHNWRQATVTMAARNFYTSDNNIFYPRVDFAGELSGITAMEFPVLNYLIYLISLVFGYEHWYGRLINLFVSTFGIKFFHKIITKYFGTEIAFNSSIILLFSIWFPYSRKIMPDTFSFSLVIIGIYYLTNYFDNAKLKYLLLYIFFTLIGVLSKLPCVFILSILLIFIIDKSNSIQQKIYFSVSTMMLLLAVWCWYFYWVPFLTATFKFEHFFMGNNVLVGAKELINNLEATTRKFFDNAIKYIGFVFFIVGMVFIVLRKQKLLGYILMLSALSYSVIMLKAGVTFCRHSYYIVSFAPIMSLIAGFGLTNIKSKKIVTIVLIAIAIEGIGNNIDDFFIPKNNYELINLEKDLNIFGTRRDKIIINSGNMPTPMYFANRKGAITFNDSLTTNEYLKIKKNQNYRFIVVLKKVMGTNIELPLKELVSNTNYTIYKLE